MGYGVKMRIYVFLEQCMHFCIFPGFQLSHLWGFYKSSLFLSCFHPQRHSRSSASPGTVVLSCRDGQSFHQSRGYWSQKKGYKSKYHRDMGYGVKMRIYVFLEQCMHFCIFLGFQLSHLWGFYKSSLFLSCFHPQRHSRSSASPGTVVLSCRDGQSFHQSRGYWGLRWEYMYFCNNVCIFVFFLVSNFPIFGDSINHPCFCNVSARNDTPGPPPLLVQWYSPATMARVFINPGAIEAKKKGCKSKYHRDMGYGVKMRIYIYIQSMY